MNSTKKSLAYSILSLMLCFSMLVGATFAWFTDTASTGVNRIVAGNLDILFEYSADGETWHEVTPATTDIFGTDNLWEPGFARVAYLRISNVGSLALKYSLIVDRYEETEGINKNGQPFLLSDYLLIGTVDNRITPFTDRAEAVAAAKSMKPMSEYQKTGSLLPGQTTSMAMVIYMPETVGNEANHDGVHIPSIEFGLHLYATQYTWESDSFGNDYDLEAQVPSLPRIVVRNIQVTPTDDEITVVFPENAPEGGNTTVTFPAGSFDLSDPDAVLNLFAATRNQTAANPNFEIDSTGNGTIAGIELTATLGENVITTFNGQYVKITTYIEKNLDPNEIKLYYVDDNDNRVEASASDGDFEIVSYDPATGEFVFRTNHFSRFEIGVPMVEPAGENLFDIVSLRGLYVMVNDTSGQNTYRLMDKEGKDLFDFTKHEGYTEIVDKLAAEGIRLEVKGNVTLDTNHFRINLFDAPLTVANGARLTLAGSLGGGNINAGTFNSLKDSAGTVKVQAGNFIGCDPVELDPSLAEDNSESIAISYTKDRVQQFLVGPRASTFVYAPSSTEYDPEYKNYTVNIIPDGGLFAAYSSSTVKNAPGHVTVALLPGHYVTGTTLTVQSSLDTVGLGDKETIIVEKIASSDSNRHLFNLNNSDTYGYDHVTIRNMKLVVSSNTNGGQDNAAIQVIRWTKAKCYDLIIEKSVSSGINPLYVNSNNTAADGIKHPVYVYYENVVCNVSLSTGLFSINKGADINIRHYNLKYNNGNNTYNGYTKGFMDYTNWDWQ